MQLAGFGLGLLLGCPTPVDPAATQPAKRSDPVLDENDPRVVREGEDLYAAEVIEKREQQAALAEPAATALGSGKPDESNGMCRLYAPELPKPECCNGEWGFDADVVQRGCGFDLYLGESFQYTCGYYFLKTGKLPSWFRMSFVAGDTPADAANTHDRKLKRVAKDERLSSTPVPGVEGAMWSTHDGLRWAFLPGWSRVRQLSWRGTDCSDEAMAKVIAQLVTAVEPPAGAQREGLVPRSRT
ncbi:MAG: hypothetical protein IAG13_28855 [Deltaproteobacteria bacterium]|nr:hypothetical protein [Nannocystaceae bacterium]